MNEKQTKPVCAAIDSLLIFVIICSPFAWILRDGLGPDSITSSGAQAVYRTFMTFYVGPILITLLGLRFTAFAITGSKMKQC